jgi:hypothetical protein
MIFLIILLLENNLQAGCWSLKTASPADPQKGGVEWHPMALVVCVERIEQIKGQTRRFQPWHVDEHTEGAKFWLKVFNELKNGGLH